MAKEVEHIYNIGDKVDNLIIMEQLRLPRKNGNRISMCKMYKYKCSICTYEGLKAESTLKRNVGCPCCNNNVVVPHINSIMAHKEYHWMIDYFQGGVEEAKLYHPTSTKKVVLKCPYCNTVKEHPMVLNDFRRRQSIGCKCSDGVSYPEKVGRSLFPLLDNDCIYQYRPQWGEGKLYDFYLPNYDMIIELHGGQHYEPRGYMVNIDIKKNDTLKKTLAKENGVTHYYEIDCRNSTFNWIVENIMSIKELDFSSIDMVQIFKDSEKNIVKEVCDFRRINPKISVKEMCERFGLSTHAIQTYLKKGSELGWCDYNLKEVANEQRGEFFRANNPNPPKSVVVFKNGVRIKEYSSLAECEQKSEEDFGVRFNKSHISQVCNQTRKTHRGYTFKYK